MPHFARAAFLALLIAPVASLAEAHTVDHHTGGEGVLHWLLDHGYIVGIGLAALTVVYLALRNRRKGSGTLNSRSSF